MCVIECVFGYVRVRLNVCAYTCVCVYDCALCLNFVFKINAAGPQLLSISSNQNTDFLVCGEKKIISEQNLFISCLFSF